MKFEQTSRKCGNCLHNVPITIGVTEQMPSELEQYLEFKDQLVHTCPNCLYSSYDITEDKNAKNIIESTSYTALAEYQDYNLEVFDNAAEDLNINAYLCNCMICQHAKDFDNALKSLLRYVRLNEMACRRQIKMVHEEAGELTPQYISNYHELTEILKNKKHTALQKAEFYYENCSKNDYCKVMYIELLIIQGNHQMANAIFDTLAENFSKNFKQYISNLR